MFPNVCKQTIPTNHVHISQKVKLVLMRNLQDIIYDDGDIGRFSNLH